MSYIFLVHQACRYDMLIAVVLLGCVWMLILKSLALNWYHKKDEIEYCSCTHLHPLQVKELYT
jgi:hypothetical protein